MVGVHRIELRVPKLLVYSQLSVHRSLLPLELPEGIEPTYGALQAPASPFCHGSKLHPLGAVTQERAALPRSEWQESNLHKLGPKPSGLPIPHIPLLGRRCHYAHSGTGDGTRTRNSPVGHPRIELGFSRFQSG